MPLPKALMFLVLPKVRTHFQRALRDQLLIGHVAWNKALHWVMTRRVGFCFLNPVGHGPLLV